MSRRAASLLERMRRTPFDWGHDEVCKMLSGYRFKCWEGGKHTICQHETFEDLTISVPRHNVLRPWVARDAVALVDEAARREVESNRGESRT